MRGITRAILALFLTALMAQIAGVKVAAAEGTGGREFARHNNGIGQPPASVGTRPLLVIAIRFAGADSEHASGGWVDSFDRDSIARRFFASGVSSVRGYMNGASGGAFSYSAARENNGVADDGVVEVSSDQSFSSYPTLWARAIAAMRAADPEVAFDSYDDDHDGQLEATELTLAVISMGTGARDAGEADSIQRSGAYANFDGVSLAQNFWAAEVTPYTNFMTTVHELFHATFATVDEYGWGVGALSVMGPTAGIADSARLLPSAVTRFQLGWLEPAVVSADGAFSLRRGEAAIVADPSAGASRYFMVEYRERAGLDAAASGTGLVVWRVDNTVSGASNGFSRAVELVTPNVLASDRRIAPCASGEHAMCHSGDTGDVFGLGGRDVVPLRYDTTGSSLYSSGAYAGIYLSDVTANSGVQITAHFGPLPSAPASQAAQGVARASTLRPASVTTPPTPTTALVTTAAVGITPAATAPIAAESLLDELCSRDVFDCATTTA